MSVCLYDLNCNLHIKFSSVLKYLSGIQNISASNPIGPWSIGSWCSANFDVSAVLWLKVLIF